MQSLPTAALPADQRLALCLVGTDGTVLAAQHADDAFYAASTIKLLVLSALLHSVTAGRLALTDEVLVAEDFTGHDGRPFRLTGGTG